MPIDTVVEDHSHEPILYINDAAYARLSALLHDARSASADPANAEVQHALFHESRLIDERRYDEWLAVFTAQCVYWVPSRAEPGDPRMETSIYLDDRRRLTDRVGLIHTGHLHAQTPPSRTRRMLTNIEQWPGDNGAVHSRANVVIWEYRHGVTRAYAGWQAYELVRGESGAFKIATKIICLLDCDAPQGNYSFIF